MSAMEMFWAAPPIARTITAATVAVSIGVHFGFIDAYYVAFIGQRVFTFTSLPEIWRIASTFLVTGPKLGLVMDPYFLYTYGSSLEREGSRFIQPGDFFVYVLFICLFTLLTGGYYLQGPFLLSALSLAFAYTYAQENPGRQMSFFIVTFSAKWLPYAMLAMTFIMASPQAALIQASGLLAAHAYDFITKIWPEHGGGSRLLVTPQFVQRWFAIPAGVPSQRAFGTAFSGRTGAAANVPQQAIGRGGARVSGFNSGWNDRGTGRRLGGD